MGNTFRLAEMNDFPDVIRIFKQAVALMCSQGIFQWDELYPSEKQLLEDIKNWHMYLLTKGGNIISAVVINEEQPEEYEKAGWEYKSGRTAVLHRLCVDPAYQNMGYGSMTVKNAEHILKEMGYTAVRLDAFSQNPFALKLYASLGYKRAGEVTFRKGTFFLYEKPL